MKKLFESKKHVTSTGAPDAKIIFSKAPFLFILPDKNFKQYIETIIISKGIFRIGIQKSRLEKTYEMQEAKASMSNFFEQIDNSTGLKYCLFVTKATNT